MGHKSRKQSTSKVSRTQNLQAEVVAEAAMPELEIGVGTQEDWEDQQVFVSRHEILEFWDKKGEGVVTPAVWQKYTRQLPGRDPFYCWLRIDDVIRLSRMYGVIDESIFDVYVSEDSESISRLLDVEYSREQLEAVQKAAISGTVCHTSLIELKLPILTDLNRERKEKGKLPLRFKDVKLPAELHPRVKFTAVRAITPPVTKERRVAFFRKLREDHVREPGNPLAGLHRNTWSILGSVFERPDGSKLPMRGSPWYFDFASGRYFFPRRGSLLSEQYEEKKKEGLRPGSFTSRVQIMAPYVKQLEYLNHGRKAEEKAQLKRFHTEAQALAWEVPVEDLGVDEFDPKEFQASEQESGGL
jgi:hypothetical protein